MVVTLFNILCKNDNKSCIFFDGPTLFKMSRFYNIHSFIHSFIGMCRMRRFLAVFRSFFHSSLLCTLSLHPVPPTSLPAFLTSSCHLFLILPLSLVVSKTFLRILFSSILCTCPNQHNLFSLIASAIRLNRFYDRKY